MQTRPRLRRMSVIVLFAAMAAACSGGGGDEAGDAASTAPPGALQVLGTDQLAFEPEQLTATAGEITVALTAQSNVAHDFVVEEGEALVTTSPAGETTLGTVTLEPGSYTFYCSIPGHRSAGMEGTLEVTD